MRDFKDYFAHAQRMREEPTLLDFYTYAGLKHDLLRLPGDPEKDLLNDPERDNGTMETQG